MKSALDKLAKKYAQAFIAVSGDVLTQESIENIQTLADVLIMRRQALFYVNMPALDEGRTTKSLFELLEKIDMNTVLRPLIDLLLKHKRMFLFPQVLRWVARLALAKKHIMKFRIESAVPLKENELTQLREFLSKKTGMHIIDQIIINKELIAGIKVYSETVGFEKSIRNQLRALQSRA